MINFISGQIGFAEDSVFSNSSYEELTTIAQNSSIEKGEDPGGPYFYAEKVQGGIRFEIYISLKGKKIDYIVLRWPDGPYTSKGWDGVSEKRLKDEYRSLLKFVQITVGRPPDTNGNRNRIWYFEWGQVSVSYESRDFITQIYMTPK